MLSYDVKAYRVDAHGSTAQAKGASITLDTALTGRADAFNPAELLLAAIAECMIKSAERVTPTLNFDLGGMEARQHGLRTASQKHPQIRNRLEHNRWGDAP